MRKQNRDVAAIVVFHCGIWRVDPEPGVDGPGVRPRGHAELVATTNRDVTATPSPPLERGKREIESAFGNGCRAFQPGYSASGGDFPERMSGDVRAFGLVLKAVCW